jgi:hypothetical protein
VLLFNCSQGKPDTKQKTEDIVMLLICLPVIIATAVAGAFICASEDNDRAALVLAEMNSAKQ